MFLELFFPLAGEYEVVRRTESRGAARAEDVARDAVLNVPEGGAVSSTIVGEDKGGLGVERAPSPVRAQIAVVVCLSGDGDARSHQHRECFVFCFFCFVCFFFLRKRDSFTDKPKRLEMENQGSIEGRE